MNDILDINDFMVVDFIPVGSVVWNIGKHMPDGYIPFVYIDEDCHILADRPKYAVKMDNAQQILNTPDYRTLESMTTRAINQFNSEITK